ncbi:hypothetical protein PM082_020618 [Marasmius tenuissimus]|nr:hypothetical protein PM082_020618 [Marasmius tenuissimus]
MLSATVSFSVLGSGGWGGVGSLAALGEVEEGLLLGDFLSNGADAFTGCSDNGDKDVQLDVPMLVLTTPDEDGAVAYDLLQSHDEETDYDSESEYDEDDEDNIDVDDIIDCYLGEEEEDVSAAGLCDGVCLTSCIPLRSANPLP